jgi:hypothetical protein
MHAIKAGMVSLFNNPINFCRQPAFLMIWGVYAGTYIVGNSIEAICEWQRRASFYPKFIGSSVVLFIIKLNAILSLFCQRRLMSLYPLQRTEPSQECLVKGRPNHFPFHPIFYSAQEIH